MTKSQERVSIHSLDLLSSKEPMTFQALQAVSSPVADVEYVPTHDEAEAERYAELTGEDNDDDYSLDYEALRGSGLVE